MSQLTVSCSFATHCNTPCNVSSRQYPSQNQLRTLSACSNNVKPHLRQLKVAQSSVSSEKELILARVGLFDEDGSDFTICPKHRDELGIKFRASKKCQHPLHGDRKGKPERGINLQMAKNIKTKWNTIVPVGAGILQCHKFISTIFCCNAIIIDKLL